MESEYLEEGVARTIDTVAVFGLPWRGFLCFLVKQHANLVSKMEIFYHVKRIFTFNLFLLKPIRDIESSQCLLLCMQMIFCFFSFLKLLIW